MTSQLLTTDPVCGMRVMPDESRHSEHAGATYYFCSQSCQNKFENDPDGILADRVKDSSPENQGDDAHSCCHGDTSGTISATRKTRQAGDGAIYTCPMHPEVEQVGPGACPICGMDLEPKYVDATDDSDKRQFQDSHRSTSRQLR